MKRTVGYILVGSLMTGSVSAAWPFFGKGGQKPIATNGTSSIAVPMPRVSPRVFPEGPVQGESAMKSTEVKKPGAHQHSPECNHSKSNRTVRATGDGKSSIFDRSEQEMQKVVQSADAGNMKSAYLMWQYYERHQETAKAEQWREKTRQLAEKAPPEDAFARQVFQRLNHPRQGKSLPD